MTARDLFIPQRALDQIYRRWRQQRRASFRSRSLPSQSQIDITSGSAGTPTREALGDPADPLTVASIDLDPGSWLLVGTGRQITTSPTFRVFDFTIRVTTPSGSTEHRLRSYGDGIVAGTQFDATCHHLAVEPDGFTATLGLGFNSNDSDSVMNVFDPVLFAIPG